MNEIPRTTVRDLIEAGALVAPAKVRGVRFGKPIDATIQRDGTFVVQKEIIASPSVAAGKAITAATGTMTPGRSYFSVNGWTFWHVKGSDGEYRSLTEIREAYLGSAVARLDG